MPLLEAVATLSRGPDAAVVDAAFGMHAPDWVLRAIGLPGATDRAEVARSTHEHTLHRLAACLEDLARDVPLALVLEDVHWCDYSTLDLLAVLARRREPARLLVICTPRQVEVVRDHPVARVKRELVRQGLCHDIVLEGLSPADVPDYLAARFAGADLPEGLWALLVESSEGNPFFLDPRSAARPTALALAPRRPLRPTSARLPPRARARPAGGRTGPRRLQRPGARSGRRPPPDAPTTAAGPRLR